MQPTGDHRAGYTTKEFFDLVEEGALAADERVELLDGLVVAMSPQNPAHAATAWHVHGLLSRLVGDRGIVRSQLPLLAGERSVPEPDVAVVPWSEDGWQFEHPHACHLAIEIADNSLMQDRLTKTRIYAGAGVENYWIVNLRSRSVEWFSAPSPQISGYAESGVATGEETLPPTSFNLRLSAAELFPAQRRVSPPE